ncbi:MAG: glycosyltransferase, partial [Burkholderiaceae bacterium]|nr:glycosyltransferase [Burkholderiaceae bacterium]
AARSASPGPTAPSGSPPNAPRPRLAVIMPAHNESAGVAAAIEAVRAQLEAHDRLLVVADNCSDDTATVAALAGATVAGRSDTLRRGKGYALDFGVRWLEGDPPDVVVIIDADCEVHGQALDRLARACIAHERPAQALYLMRSAPGAGLKTRIAEFAWALKNHARALGNQRLGLPCQLMGSGMAFTWAQIRGVDLASGHIVEDLQLGLDLTARGFAPRFCPEALVTSVFPVSEEGLTAQRTRWEHGYLDVIFKRGPRLLRQALAGGRVGPLLTALDLCVPPLASLVLVQACLVVLGIAFLAVTHRALPAGLAVLGLSITTLALGLGWWQFGRRIVSLTDLMGVPLYMAAKVPMYLRVLRRRQVEWVRTRRDDGKN